ncbi:glycosyltransferase family 4 protein [Candidatus Neomarinimicrobiota bacterium]
MNILVTAPFLKTGGVLHCVDALLPYLGNVDIIQRGKQSKTENFIKTVIVQLWIYIKFIIEIIRNDYDAVLINTSIGYYTCIRDGIFVIISKLLRNKTILYIHGYRIKVLNHRLFRIGYFFSSKIIVLSSELKEKIKLTGFKRDVYKTYNPVDISIIDANIIDKPQDVINLLYLARIEKEKGILIALEAYKLAKKKNSNIIFNIAGDGEYFEKAKEYTITNQINDVNFYGFVTGQEKIDLLNKSHILMLPTSHEEGLPVTILESMASGLVIVTRPIGGIVDFFQQGKTGYLFNSLNPIDFAEGILNSVNRFNSISANNKEFARNNFHPKKIAKNLLSTIY